MNMNNNIHTLFLGNDEKKVVFDATGDRVQLASYLWRIGFGFCIVDRSSQTKEVARLSYKKLLKQGYHSKPWIIEG
jgi:hypothetical protein